MIVNIYLVLILIELKGSLCEILTVYVKNGSNKCLKCPSTDPPGAITWLVPPNDMAYAVGLDVNESYSFLELNTTTNSSILCITMDPTNYLGNYKCYGYDFKNSFRFIVKIRLKPTNITITNRGENGRLTVEENKNITLNCTIKAGDPMWGKLQWIHNNKTLISNYTDSLQLTLKPTTADSGSIYRCEAVDEDARVIESDSISLKVNGRPLSPIILKPKKTSTVITISWKSKYDGGYQQSFAVQYREYNKSYMEKNDGSWKTFNTSQQNFLVLSNLSQQTKYVIRMYAFNKINRSDYTEEIIVTTLSTSAERTEELESKLNGYYAFLVIPAVVVAAVLIYYSIRGKKLPGIVSRCFEVQDEYQGQNVVDVGPVAVGNNMYGQVQNQPPARRNEEAQVYSSFDRRHNISLSTHAQSVSYDVRPKPRPDKSRTHKKKSKAKENDRTTNCEIPSTAADTEKQEPQELNYVEVTFETKKEDSKLRIHGQHPKTDYVDIDFTKKLHEPPAHSDDDDSDDDFENAFAIRKMKRKTNFQE